MRGQRNISYGGYGVPPEHAYPFPNSPVRETALSCPLFGGLGHAFDCDLDVRAFVPSLLELGRPSAILRGIPLVVINAIKFEAGSKPSVHVSNKVLDVEPSLADLNSTGSVPVPSLVSWVPTTTDHVLPDHVKAMIPEAVDYVNQCPAPSVASGRDSKALN